MNVGKPLISAHLIDPDRGEYRVLVDLTEEPSTYRYMLDDGTIIDVTGHNPHSVAVRSAILKCVGKDRRVAGEAWIVRGDVNIEVWEPESGESAPATSSTASPKSSVTRSTTKPKLSDASKKLVRKKAGKLRSEALVDEQHELPLEVRTKGMLPRRNAKSPE